MKKYVLRSAIGAAVVMLLAGCGGGERQKD